MRRLLTQLTKIRRLRIAIVSGRSLRDLKKRVAIPGLLHVGDHGLEIDLGKSTFITPSAKPYEALMKRLATLLAPLAERQGIILEKKRWTLSLHYRLATPAVAKQVQNNLRKHLAPFLKQKTIFLKPAKKCIEVRPNVSWDKGQAVLWLLRRFRTKPPALPIYLGDDQTDEDAFRALKITRPRGLSIRVGKKRNTEADYFLPNVQSVQQFLTWFARKGASLS